jgi:hypothetical protein
MSDQSTQSFKSHGRLDPPFHIVLATVLAVNLFIVLSYAWHNLSYFTAWLVILSIAAWIPVLKLRLYPLKVQDRVQALAPVEWHAQIYRLTVDQLIGLRFASDDEVVSLAKTALEQNLNRKQIKERIKDWRPDEWRV